LAKAVVIAIPSTVALAVETMTPSQIQPFAGEFPDQRPNDLEMVD